MNCAANDALQMLTIQKLTILKASQYIRFRRFCVPFIMKSFIAPLVVSRALLGHNLLSQLESMAKKHRRLSRAHCDVTMSDGSVIERCIKFESKITKN